MSNENESAASLLWLGKPNTAWCTSDSRLKVNGPIDLTSPVPKLDVTARTVDGVISFLYGPTLDEAYDCQGDKLALLHDMRPQLDEVRACYYHVARAQGLPLTSSEVLFFSATYLCQVDEGLLFVLPVLSPEDDYARCIRYGRCSSMAADDGPSSIAEALMFDGYQVSDDAPWIRDDGTQTTVTELCLARAPIPDGTPCMRPWADAQLDAFLAPYPSSRWMRISHEQ